MSMCSYVVGIAPPDDEWRRMKAVYDSCRVAGVGVPQEVIEFFNGEQPDDKGVIIRLNGHESTKPIFENNPESGFEVDVSKLPSHVKIIRFVNSW